MAIEYIISKPGEGLKDKFIYFIIKSDLWFIPTLSERTDLETYADKLYNKGTKFICLENGDIIGAAVVYVNSAPDYTFGTYLAVNPKYEGDGIGLQLILESLQYAKKIKSKGYKLKMRTTNQMLLKFYKRLGFEITGENKYENSDLHEYELTKLF